MASLGFIAVAITVVLALAWIITRSAFTAPASSDLIWRTALVAVALIPMLPLVRGQITGWRWQLPVLRAAETFAPPLHHTTNKSRAPRDESSMGRQARTESPLVRLDNAPKAAATIPTEITESVMIAEQPKITQSGPIWLAVAAGLWLLGCLLQLWRIVRAAWNTRATLSAVRPVTDPESIALNCWSARQVGLKRPAELVTSPHALAPVVYGFVRPRILIPSSLSAQGDQSHLRAALLHECGHIRRHDLAFELLLKVVLAVFWPHPLVHLMAAQVRRLREEMCDNFVLAWEFPAKYAEILLQLAVGKRLGESRLLGLGMFARTHRLEERVTSLLAANRPRATRPRRLVYWSVITSWCMLLAAASLIRIDAVAAAAPAAVPADDVPVKVETNEPKKAQVGDGSKPNAKQPDANAPSSARQFEFQVVTPAGKPVVGATVTAWAMGCFVSSFAFEEKTCAQTKTDSSGMAHITCTEEMDRVATAVLGHTGPAGIHSIALSIEHPDHPIWREYVNLAGDRRIVLAESRTISVRAHRAGESASVSRLYPELGANAGADWSEANGVLTIRRVDVSSKEGSRWLRIVHAPEHGPAWFSDPIDLRHLAGNPISLNVSLNPGVRVEGRLAENVPRPVRSGRVVAGVVNGQGGERSLFWNAAADIAADGTFVLESLPRDHDLQLIALADGWVSRSPSKAELAAYTHDHGLQGLENMSPEMSFVLPQLYRLTGAVIKPVVALERTTACEVTVVDQEGRPIPNATVAFAPNELFQMGAGTGSSLLGEGVDGMAFIRAQIASGSDRKKPEPHEPANPYSAKTDARGIATVPGLPVPDSSARGFQLAGFMVAHDGYIAVPNHTWSFPAPMLAAPLARGKTERITVRMKPKLPTQTSAADSPIAAVAKNVLTGTVLDEHGQPIEGVLVLPGNDDRFKLRTDNSGRFQHKIEGSMGDEPPFWPVRFVKPGFAPLIRTVPLGEEGPVITLDTRTYFEGLIKKPDGEPAANVLVRANQQDQGWNLDPVWTETRTDSAGRYKLHVQAGGYLIQFGNSSAATAWVPKLSGPNAILPTDEPAVTRRPGESPRLWIRPNEAKKLDVQLDRGVEFRAKIVDSVTGQPIANVMLLPNGFPDTKGQSNQQGLATISTLPRGEVTFWLGCDLPRKYLRASSERASQRWKNQHRQARSDASTTAMAFMDEGVAFDLEPGMSEVTIALEPAVTMRGRVLDPEGKPVSDATVRLVPLGANTESTRWRKFYSDADGSFTATCPPSDGRKYQLMVHDGGRKRAQGQHAQFDDNEWRIWANGVGTPLSTTAGQTIENIELRLTRPGVIRGRTVDKTGKPVAGALVQSDAADGLEGAFHQPTAHSDGNGIFELRLVSPGRHRLLAKESAKLTVPDGNASPVVEVRSGETTNADVVVISTKD